MSSLVTREDLIDILQGYEKKILELEKRVSFVDWRSVGGANESVTFSGGWGNYGGSYQTAQFSHDESGTVFLRGCLKNGANGIAAFTLPEGFRPAKQLIFVTHAYNTTIGNDFCRLVVMANGQVIPITDYGLTEEVWITCQFKFGTV